MKFPVRIAAEMSYASCGDNDAMIDWFTPCSSGNDVKPLDKITPLTTGDDVAAQSAAMYAPEVSVCSLDAFHCPLTH